MIYKIIVAVTLINFLSIKKLGLLICTLIFENQGLENLRSVSNLRKISGPVHLDFFQVHGINQGQLQVAVLV